MHVNIVILDVDCFKKKKEKKALDKKTASQPKMLSYFVSHLMFHRFSPFNCCLSVVL